MNMNNKYLLTGLFLLSLAGLWYQTIELSEGDISHYNPLHLELDRPTTGATSPASTTSGGIADSGNLNDSQKYTYTSSQPAPCLSLDMADHFRSTTGE